MERTRNHGNNDGQTALICLFLPRDAPDPAGARNFCPDSGVSACPQKMKENETELVSQSPSLCFSPLHLASFSAPLLKKCFPALRGGRPLRLARGLPLRENLCTLALAPLLLVGLRKPLWPHAPLRLANVDIRGRCTAHALKHEPRARPRDARGDRRRPFLLQILLAGEPRALRPPRAPFDVCHGACLNGVENHRCCSRRETGLLEGQRGHAGRRHASEIALHVVLLLWQGQPPREKMQKIQNEGPHTIYWCLRPKNDSRFASVAGPQSNRYSD
jgi:hypothetical protein